MGLARESSRVHGAGRRRQCRGPRPTSIAAARAGGRAARQRRRTGSSHALSAARGFRPRPRLTDYCPGSDPPPGGRPAGSASSGAQQARGRTACSAAPGAGQHELGVWTRAHPITAILGAPWRGARDPRCRSSTTSGRPTHAADPRSGSMPRSPARGLHHVANRGEATGGSWRAPARRSGFSDIQGRRHPHRGLSLPAPRPTSLEKAGLLGGRGARRAPSAPGGTRCAPSCARPMRRCREGRIG
jgi:hypothetical protein